MTKQRKKPHSTNSVTSRTRAILGIPKGIKVADYMVDHGYTRHTPHGRVKIHSLALRLIESQVKPHTQRFFDELKAIFDEYEISVANDSVTEVLEIKLQKAQVMYEYMRLVHVAVPAFKELSKFRRAQQTRATKPRKLDEEKEARIFRQYTEGSTNGQLYGLVKRLAGQYDVSSTTIQNVVKKHKNKNAQINQ